MEDVKKKETLKASLEKVALTDAGIKNKYGYGLDSPIKSIKEEKNKICYPTMYLNSKEAPDFKGCEIGEEKTVVMKVRVKSHSLSEGENHSREDFTLEILKIGLIK